MSGAATQNPTDAYVQNTVERRFKLNVDEEDQTGATASMSLPMDGLSQLSTPDRALGPISFLVDGACGLVNHYKSPPNSFAITSELSFDVATDVAASADVVVARARLVASTASSSLAECSLYAAGAEIGVGTVRSFYVSATATPVERCPETLESTDGVSLAELLRVSISADDTSSGARADAVVVQQADPVLNNYMGIVHGGVIASSMDVAAHSALARMGAGGPLHTASMRISYLRPTTLGGRSRYEARVQHAGRSSGICETTAFDKSGAVSAVARVTCHRLR
ncbi:MULTISPECIES: PaaI family thioesterase [Actinomycetes]|uniref:PaaI family thioesterase n=1 Tax=Actinomycetes TaxID=1760 RepID=UPI00068D05A5|nr:MULTISPECIES: PaaI family thioesterase [Actinomycetes]